MTRFAVALSTILIAVALFLGCHDQPPEPTVVAHRLVSVTVTDEAKLPGQTQPARADTVTLWLADGLARRDNHAGSLLVDTRQRLLTMVDPHDRTYVRGTTAEVFQQLAALAADTLRSPDRKTRLLQSMLDVDARVTDTGEVEVIGGYRCRRWVVEQRFGTQQTTSEVWLTTDLDVDVTLLQQATQPALAALPGGEDALAELSRLEGMPVWTTSLMQVLGQTTRSETRLVAADLDTVPVSFFLPPEGFEDRAPNSH